MPDFFITTLQYEIETIEYFLQERFELRLLYPGNPYS